MKQYVIIYLGLIAFSSFLWAKNPIIANQGVNDPHIKIFNGKAYLYATHDRSMGSKKFLMDDWWVWSSQDLVNWKLESVLKPQQTYLGEPFDQCWATDAAFRNGKYYWYFSEGNQQTGVVESETPAGPWNDPLGKPLLDSDMTDTDEYDIAVFKNDDGEFYALFGVWEYYLARLNEDMISLAEAPRKVVIHQKEGPYGKGKTDDKPFLHKYNGTYYLSWGCFYAMSRNLYGPYEFAGTVMNEDSFTEGYAEPTWPNGPLQGRHGSFFEWHNQWYFAYCDMSQTGNRRFRDTFISYVHYKDNGEIAPVRVDGVGVGEYDAGQSVIEAEDYFKAEGIRKIDKSTGFMITPVSVGAFVTFPNIRNLKKQTHITFKAALNQNDTVEIEIHKGSPEGKIIKRCTLAGSEESGQLQEYTFVLNGLDAVESLCFVFKAKTTEYFGLESFWFSH